METPELIVALLVTAVAAGVLVGVITSWVAVERLHFHAKVRQARRENAADLRQQEQDKRDILQDAREFAVIDAEQALRRRAKEAFAVVHAEYDRIDTQIQRVIDEPAPGARFENADTIAMAAVRSSR